MSPISKIFVCFDEIILKRPKIMYLLILSKIVSFYKFNLESNIYKMEHNILERIFSEIGVLRSQINQIDRKMI